MIEALLVNSGILGRRTFAAFVEAAFAGEREGIHATQMVLTDELTFVERAMRRVLCTRLVPNRPGLRNLDRYRYRAELNAGLTPPGASAGWRRRGGLRRAPLPPPYHFNPGVVTLWLGPARFGGLGLNAAVAALVVAHSLGHGLFTTSATPGTRVGGAGAGRGEPGRGAHAGAAAGAGRRRAGGGGEHGGGGLPRGGLDGAEDHGARPGGAMAARAGPWALRASLLLALGAAVGALATRVSVWLPIALAPPLAALYLWAVRPLYEGMPVPARIRPWLVRLRLVPAE